MPVPSGSITEGSSGEQVVDESWGIGLGCRGTTGPFSGANIVVDRCSSERSVARTSAGGAVDEMRFAVETLVAKRVGEN